MATNSTSSTTALVLSKHDVFIIVICLVALATVVVLQPLVLSIIGRPKGASAGNASSFFNVPFITWFLVHYGIAALAVVAILILGIDGVINTGTVSALLGSLFGYVLGSASRSGGQSQGNAPSGGGPGPVSEHSGATGKPV